VLFFKNPILEQQVISRPIFHLDEISNIYEDTIKSLDSYLKVPKDVYDSFKMKENLCPDIWLSGKKHQIYDTIRPDVKKKLMHIAIDFFNSMELEKIKIKDILIVGSLANYNWSKYSDVDLHIVVDFSDFNESTEFVKNFFDTQKNLYNKRHNIKIKGFPVELYVQDTKEKLSAAAVYSIPRDKWLHIPEKTKLSIDKNIIKRKLKSFFDEIKHIKKDYDNQKYKRAIHNIEKLQDKIKKMRKSGLEKEGEFSLENILFKILRRSDIMELIDTLKIKTYDASVTLKEIAEDIQLPEDPNAELKAIKNPYVSHIKKLSPEKFENTILLISQAQNIRDAYRQAFKQNKPNFSAKLGNKVLTATIPQHFFNSPQNINYFDDPCIGDGALQVSINLEGYMMASDIRPSAKMTHQPNLGQASDCGNYYDFKGQYRYFRVKVGLSGKYQKESTKYSVFQTPTIDAVIKARVYFKDDILNFLNPSSAHKPLSSPEIVAKQDAQGVLKNIRARVEGVLRDNKWLGKDETIAHKPFWRNYATKFLKRYEKNPFKKGEDFIWQETLEAMELYKKFQKNPQTISLTGTPEMSDWEKEQKAKAERIAAAKARQKSLK
jgi:hypothetical protein